MNDRNSIPSYAIPSDQHVNVTVTVVLEGCSNSPDDEGGPCAQDSQF